MERLICIVIGYIFGLIQSGYLYGKANHMDIRQYGSGNAGSTERPACDGKESGRDRIFRGLFQGSVCNGSLPSAV